MKTLPTWHETFSDSEYSLWNFDGEPDDDQEDSTSRNWQLNGAGRCKLNYRMLENLFFLFSPKLSGQSSIMGLHTNWCILMCMIWWKRVFRSHLMITIYMLNHICCLCHPLLTTFLPWCTIWLKLDFLIYAHLYPIIFSFHLSLDTF